MTQDARIFALIVAAGTGSRAGGGLPKQYQPIGGRAMLRYSLEALASHPRIAGVMVVVHAEHGDLYREASSGGKPSPLGGEGLDEGMSHLALSSSRPLTQPSPARGEGSLAAPLSPKLLPPVVGGEQRSDSVAAGLEALAHYNPDYVLIHDAARPFLSHAMIDALIDALSPDIGVIPALAVADTVRRFDGASWQEVPREGLMRVQTPQAFAYDALRAVTSDKWQVTPDTPVTCHPSPATPTDEAAIWLAAGFKLAYVAGDEGLRKVTTAEDIAWANARASAARRVAVGMGYDVHALMPAGEKHTIRLGGIDIPNAHMLHGHSDADVVLHAVVDALLGAIAAGDIGSFFPPSDARWKGANSAIFIEEARAQVAARGGEISHLDVTIIGEQPKISPHREAMRAAIAGMLKLPITRVSIKATTTEKLGFTGREEGIACQAVATVSLPTEAA
jgi:2-C-methyl-D-erythritol 4-phosphate cytidylyltransferase/2-C-methyl-D-erythritol 2,4-cyclodiphosphate synthase